MTNALQSPQQKSTLDDFATSNIAVFSGDTFLREKFSSIFPEYTVHPTQNLDELINYFKRNNLPQIYVVDLYGINPQKYPAVVDIISSLKKSNPKGRVLVLATEKQAGSTEYTPIRTADIKDVIDTVLIRPNGLNSSQRYEERVTQFLDTRVADYLGKRLSNPPLVKIGGSMYDVRAMGKIELWQQLVQEIAELFPVYSMIVSVGGGPKQDINKTYWNPDYMSTSHFENLSRRALEDQAITLEDNLHSIGADARYVKPTELNIIDAKSNILREKLHIVALSEKSDIPPSQSDAHALAIADSLELNRVIFVKNTDGIYLWDPNAQHNQGYIEKLKQRLREVGSGMSEHLGGANRFFRTIKASEILRGDISRWGFDNNGQISDNHVVERSALEYFLNTTRHVQRIQVINGTKRGTLESALKGEYVGSYILKS